MRFEAEPEPRVLRPTVVGVVLIVFGLAWYVEGALSGRDHATMGALAMFLGYWTWRLGKMRAKRREQARRAREEEGQGELAPSGSESA